MLPRDPARLKASQETSAESVEMISQSFASARQEDPALPANLCMDWLTLARAYAFSFGETKLTREIWDRFLTLERERLSRCRRFAEERNSTAAAGATTTTGENLMA